MINRRSFLKRMACSGALIATSQLPSFAEDKPSVFPQRGQYERLSLSYAVVELGLKKPFSVLHISDSHLAAAYAHENEKKQELSKSRTINFGGRQEEALRDALSWAKQHVDYVIHTGDLIDWQSEANFDLVKKYFGDGLIGSLGNHEFSTDMWLSDPKEEKNESYKDNTRKKLQEVYPFNVRFQSQVVNDVNFITLDDVYGYVTEEQVNMFKEEVKKGGDEAIRRWIDSNMQYRSCLIVLVGEHTSKRRWVDYEIRKAWEKGMGVFGIYIHRIKDPLLCQQGFSGYSNMGENPFDKISFKNGNPLSSVVPCYNPDPNDAYNDIGGHLEEWVEKAIKARG